MLVSINFRHPIAFSTPLCRRRGCGRRVVFLDFLVAGGAQKKIVTEDLVTGGLLPLAPRPKQKQSSSWLACLRGRLEGKMG